MKDGTLPHFIPDRRERLLDALAQLGSLRGGKLETRLWGAVVIDGTKCVSCRMCATFCPTGAIAKFDDADGTLGVPTPRRLREVRQLPGRVSRPTPSRCSMPCLQAGSPTATATAVMTPRPVSLTDNPHQILDTFRLDFNGDIFER